MPNISIQTIKGVKQKNSGGSYSSLLPFGTDGQYIDMASGLDLEKELKLGGDHYSSIKELPGGITEITETYAKNPKENINQQNYYSVVTTIQENATETIINIKLYFYINSNTRILKREKNITIQENGNTTEIEEILEQD